MTRNYVRLKLLGHTAMRAIKCMHAAGILPGGTDGIPAVDPVGVAVTQTSSGEVDIIEKPTGADGRGVQRSRFVPGSDGYPALASTSEAEIRDGLADKYRALANACANKAVNLMP